MMHYRRDFIKNNRWQILLCASILLLQLPLAGAATDAVLDQKNKTNAAAKPAASPQKADELGLTVDDINDLGIALQRIRQQAVNIFVEATRRKGAAEVSAHLANLTAVPNELPKDQSKLMPFRRPWLVYFITTLEPLVHLLKEDLKDVEIGAKTLEVTAEQKKALDPYIKEWSLGVGRIDEHLRQSAELVEDAEKNNIALAKLASELDKEVVKLEQVREKAFDIVESQKQAKK